MVNTEKYSAFPVNIKLLIRYGYIDLFNSFVNEVSSMNTPLPKELNRSIYPYLISNLIFTGNAEYFSVLANLEETYSSNAVA